MEKIKPAYYVFQTDSEIVKLVYEKQDNYLIEFNEEGDKKLCAIYFVVMIFIILTQKIPFAKESFRKITLNGIIPE